MKSVIAILFCVFGGLVFGQNLRTYTASGLYGYKRGKDVVIPAKFSYAADFSFGRAAVLINKKWGYIDEKGTLVIPATLEIAESFHSPYVLIHENNQIGLMDTSGKRVVPAVCDEIYDNGNAWHLKRGKLRGAYIEEYNSYIESKYQGLDYHEHFILAELDRNNYDVYSSTGKFLGSNKQHRPAMAYSYNADYCDLTRSDSAYVVDQNGKRISETYIDIHRESTYIPISVEGVSSDSYNDIFLLHLPAPDDEIMVDENGEIYSNRFHLFYGNTYLNDAVYSDYGLHGREFMVKRNGVWCKFENGKLVPSKYIGEEQFNAYWLFYRADSTVDVAQLGFENDTLFIEHFYRATIPTIEYANEYYNPDYPEEPETLVLQIGLPVLEVENEAGLFAIYDIDQKAYLTSFSASRYWVEINYNTITKSREKRTISVLKNEAGLLAFIVNGKQSEFVFNSFEFLDLYGILMKDDLGRRLFIPFKKDTIIELPAHTGVSPSMGFWNDTEYSIDPETGEEIWVEPQHEFSFDFLILTSGSENTKYGFINSDYSVIEYPKYDQLYGSENTSMAEYELIVTEQNDLFGFYDLHKNVEFKPRFKQMLDFEYALDYLFPYTRPDSLNYYLSSTGKKFKAQYNDGYPFKLDGKMGYISYDDFSDAETDTLIPAVYKSLKPLYEIPFLIATNKQNKKGLLTLVGDTLLPFEYDEISWQEDFSTFDYRTNYIFELSIGKKKGLYSSLYDRFTPSVYDDIEVQYAGDNGHVGSYRVAANGKCGLYSGVLTPTFPCELDAIDFIENGEFPLSIIQKGSKVAVGHSFSPDFFRADSSDWYDYVVERTGYKKYGAQFISYNIGSFGVPSDTVAEIQFFEPDLYEFEIFEKDGLLGLRDRESKKVLVKPSLNYIRLVDDSNYIKFEEGIMYYASIYSKKSKYRVSQW